MLTGLRMIAALALVLPGAVALAAGSAQAQEPVPPEVRAVIERSRNPTTDYSVFHVERVTFEGRRFIQTSAEYHRGVLQRVETMPMRVIANCETGESAFWRVDRARVERGTEGFGACGIADYEPVLSSRMLPPVTGPYGRAHVIELTGPDFVRRYTVTEDGIIAAGDYVPRRPDVSFAIETLHSEVRRGSPDAVLFEEASLARAHAPAPETLMPAPANPRP